MARMETSGTKAFKWSIYILKGLKFMFKMLFLNDTRDKKKNMIDLEDNM